MVGGHWFSIDRSGTERLGWRKRTEQITEKFVSRERNSRYRNYVAKAYTKCNVDAEILLNSLYWFEYQKQQMA